MTRSNCPVERGPEELSRADGRTAASSVRRGRVSNEEFKSSTLSGPCRHSVNYFSPSNGSRTYLEVSAPRARLSNARAVREVCDGNNSPRPYENLALDTMPHSPSIGLPATGTQRTKPTSEKTRCPDSSIGISGAILGRIGYRRRTSFPRPNESSVRSRPSDELRQPVRGPEGAPRALLRARGADVGLVGARGGFQQTIIEYAQNLFG